MKTKMKTKMKTILPICILSILLYACSKNDTPIPVDCMGIENGLAAVDECGTCHQSYMYQPPGGVTYISTYEDTTDLIGMLVLAGTPLDITNNLTWNGGPLAAIDSCGDCHQSYIYNFVTHVPTYINDTTGLVLDPSSEMLILAGSDQDIDSNPNWNAGCK